jgi:transposase-like protein
MSETATPWEFRVQGEQGSEADAHRGACLGGPEIEVVAKATRRRFTLEYKRKIVREADGCKTPGAVGALLRREGLYSSHLATWRAARDREGLFHLVDPGTLGPAAAVPRHNRLRLGSRRFIAGTVGGCVQRAQGRRPCRTRRLPPAQGKEVGLREERRTACQASGL